MIEQTLRTLVESRYRWLIVISVTSAIGLALLLPLVDDYFAGRKEKADLTRELENSRLAAQQLEPLEKRVGEETSKLDELLRRTVSEKQVSLYRGRLVDLARRTGCQIRRITVGTVHTRPWHEKDDPLADRVDPAAVGKETGLQLRRQPVSVSVSGSMSNLQSLLEEMRKDRMLMHTRNFDLRPAGQNRRMVNLEMELWFFDLSTPTGTSA